MCRGFAVSEELAPVAAHDVSLKAIRDGWDELLRLVASIQSGRLSAAGSLQTVGGQSNHGRIEQYARIDTLTAAEPVVPPIESKPAESAAVPPIVDKPAQPDSSTQVADTRPTAPVAPPAVEQPAQPAPPTQVANTTPAAPVVRPVAPPSPVSWIVHRMKFWLASFFPWA